jgi:DnaK suppressor protein
MRTKSNREPRVEELRARLLAERAAILSDRQTQLRVLTTPENTGAEDQVPLLHEQFVAISTTSRNRRKYALIKRALERLEQGEYGICEECEEQIPFKRLYAVPWAACCVPCQEHLEMRGLEEGQALAATASSY